MFVNNVIKSWAFGEKILLEININQLSFGTGLL